MKKLACFFLCLIFAVCLPAQVTVVQSPVPKFRSFTPAGTPNVGGCVYTFASGTSTPQQTFTDFTGLTPNSNPVVLDANGEAAIFITNATYRFQVWSFGSGVLGSNCGNGVQLYQIDGIRDTGLAGFSGPATINATANGQDLLSLNRFTDVSPSGNFINAKTFSGSTVFKVDVLGNVTANNITSLAALSAPTATLTNGILNFTEVATPVVPPAGTDILWGSSAAHRLQVNNPLFNLPANLVISGQDINTSDFVTQVHFGATPTAFSGTAPTTGQFLQWNGSNIVGTTTVVSQTSASTAFNVNLTAQTIVASVPVTGPVFIITHALESVAGASCSAGSNTVQVTISFTAPGGTTGNLPSPQILSITGNGAVDNGLTQNQGLVEIVAKAGTAITYTTATSLASTGCSPIPQYVIYAKAEF